MLSDLFALYSDHPMLYAGSVFVIGLVVGSFLNVVIYRLPIILDRQWRAQASDLLPSGRVDMAVSEANAPERFTLSVPRSACPHCKAPIKAWQNIPVVSWFVLRGRCASCKAPISPRYPAVELATGVLSAVVAWHFGVSLSAVCALLMTWALVALTGIDIDHQLLPDDITLPLMWAGLLAAVVFGALPGLALPVSPRDAIIGAAAGYLSLWLVFHVFRLVTGKEGMGYGDFKLLAAMGAWMGPSALLPIILLSSLIGALFGVVLIATRKLGREVPMPFGPFIAAAGWVWFMAGDTLLQAYLNLSGMR